MTPLPAILLVEDDPGMRRAVERVLGPFYAVQAATTVREALALLSRPGLEVALIDVQLPDGDGYALTRTIQQRQPEVDVILMTGSSSGSDENLYRALEENAFYFLYKPFERRVLLALVERCLRLKRERRAKEAFSRQAQADLEQARRFQHSLLPRGTVSALGWKAEGRFRPCDALGGDFYQVHQDLRGSLVFSLSDVVGHGVSAAMVAGMVRSALDAARRKNPDPVHVISEVATGADFLSAPRFVTLIYGQLFADGRCRYGNAGHPPLLWLGAQPAPRELSATGPLLTSSLASLNRRVEEVHLAVGDRLLLYSDGLFEARDAADRELGIPGVAELFGETRDLPLGEALDRLLTELARHCGGRPLEDDVTLLLLERTSQAEETGC